MSTNNAPTYKAIIKKYHTCSSEVKWYFESLPRLVAEFPYEVSLAYLFLRTEKAHNRALYCGVVKLHRADKELADSVTNRQHLKREGFVELYKNIFGHSLVKTTLDKIKTAEKIRDKAIHGKNVSRSDMREAITDVLDYAEALNSDLQNVAGFKPFGDLRGFKGGGQSLDSGTTRWLLKGLGFAVS